MNIFSFSQRFNPEFIYRFRPILPKRKYRFREEVVKACRVLDEKRKGKTIALCHSGGLDSELIAFTLRELGIPFTCYFLDIWGLNRESFEENWKKCLQTNPIKIVPLAKNNFYENYSINIFKDFGCELPTYIALSYLFEKIPIGEYIVVGDGDLNRSGPLFEVISSKHLKNITGDGLYLPYSAGSIFYYLWANKRKREGEFYFFSSTPELIASVFTHPLYQNFNTRDLIYSEFPELQKRNRTTNWESEMGSKENVWIRNWLIENVEDYPKFYSWRRSIGTQVNMLDLFKSQNPPEDNRT